LRPALFMSRPPIVLLHGANGSGAEMAPLAEALAPYGGVRAPDLPGHGGRALPERFSLADQAADLAAWIDREALEKPVVVGYSLGGYLALYFARHYPKLVAGACALATKHVFDEGTIQRWVYLAQPERLDREGNSRGAELALAHAPQDWKEVTRRTARLFEDLGREAPLSDADFAAIEAPVMIVSANRDQIVPWDETLALGQRIPGSHVAMFYGIAHPLRVIPVGPVARAIGTWIEKVRST
jgi:pimeloyl-ACP methyl ester carboxylesterase